MVLKEKALNIFDLDNPYEGMTLTRDILYFCEMNRQDGLNMLYQTYGKEFHDFLKGLADVGYLETEYEDKIEGLGTTEISISTKITNNLTTKGKNLLKVLHPLFWNDATDELYSREIKPSISSLVAICKSIRRQYQKSLENKR